jgi:predicted nucleotidyltransferase
MIDLDPDARLDVFAYVGLKRFIEELFDRPVDVVDRNALKPYVRGPAIADAINAF